MHYRSQNNDLSVSICDRCFEHWAKYQQRRFWQIERGGLLFSTSVGTLDGRVWVVNVSGPNRGDRAGRYWLELDHAKLLRDIEDQFAKGFHFVGYWHTHPEPDPTLSGLDFSAFADNLTSDGIELTRMIAVIVGNAVIRPSTSVYVVSATGSEKLQRATSATAQPNPET